VRALTIGIAILTICFPGRGLADDAQRPPAPSTAGPQDHTFERAGMPQNISRLAVSSVGKHEGPGYVGGGRLIHGDSRGPTDGTFAFDYEGFGWLPGRVFLGWVHDRKEPGPGTYRTDTYRIPDPFSLHPVRRIVQDIKEGTKN
jgi:hypothetical protein